MDRGPGANRGPDRHTCDSDVDGSNRTPSAVTRSDDELASLLAKVERLAEKRRMERVARGEPEPADPEPQLPPAASTTMAAPRYSPELRQVVATIDQLATEFGRPPQRVEVLRELGTPAARWRRALRFAIDAGYVRESVPSGDYARAVGPPELSLSPKAWPVVEEGE